MRKKIPDSPHPTFQQKSQLRAAGRRFSNSRPLEPQIMGNLPPPLKLGQNVRSSVQLHLQLHMGEFDILVIQPLFVHFVQTRRTKNG